MSQANRTTLWKIRPYRIQAVKGSQHYRSRLGQLGRKGRKFGEFDVLRVLLGIGLSILANAHKETVQEAGGGDENNRPRTASPYKPSAVPQKGRGY